ncbi:MAG: phosphatase PAP2 family protein [Bacteriovoracia bacterium]
MRNLAAILLTFLSLNALARPSCLITKECFEYEGQIIDLRSTGAKMYQDSLGCDALVENCLGKTSQYQMPQLNEEEFKKLVGKKGTEYFIPIDIRSQDMKILAGALSLGVVLFANDRAIMNFVQDTRTQETQEVADVFNFAGGRVGMASLAAGSYFIGAVMKNGKLKQVGLFTIGAGLATQIVTEVFKKSFGRVRPNGTDSPYDFFEDGKSFFSGHASAAFSMATVIAEVYKDKPLVPYLAYGAAALTAYARMHDNKHWASDVLAGAVAGHLVTKIFMRAFDKSEGSMPSGLVIVPQIGKEAAGIQIYWRPGEKKRTSRCTKLGLEGEALIRACFDEAFNS